MLCALQRREEKERERCLLLRKSKVCGRGVVSHLTSTNPDETQAARPTWGRKKKKKLFMLSARRSSRKKKWGKSWPPVNTPQFPLMFVQMLTPINRWHNILLHFLFCSAFSKALTPRSVNHLRERLLLRLWKIDTFALRWSSQALWIWLRFTQWNIFERVRHHHQNPLADLTRQV